MTNRKRERTPSEKSLSSLSDSAIKAGRKAKQVALQTVKSITALIKKPCKTRVIPDTNCKLIFLIQYHQILPLFLCIANTEPKRVDDELASTYASSMMDIEPASTRASSKMSTNQFVSISDDKDNDAKEEKIIKEVEKKISK